jgi:hypothetical protein
MLWIVGAVYGGYVMANVLKWYWWRFNGYGYFWGMVSGIATSLLLLLLGQLNAIPFLNDWPIPANPNMNSFPLIFLNSIVGCIVATFLTRAEPDDVLMKFYAQVRPWGFWRPVREKVMKLDPAFVPNKNFKRDAVNVVVGASWQITLMAAPVFLVLREFTSFAVCVAVLIVTSIFLKVNWWDRLESAYGESSTGATPGGRIDT